MAGQILLSAPKTPAPTIKLASGGAPGGIVITPRSTPAPKAAPKTNPGTTVNAGGGGGGSVPQVFAPALDTGAIYNRASSTAASNVNPYYSKLINDFVTQQGTARTQQQKQTEMNIQTLQENLAKTLEANALTGTRATEDAATGEAQIAQAADNRQTDQGTAYDATRTGEAIKLAESGLTGSGLGAGQQATTQATQDTLEKRQAEADQVAKDNTELAKARTFEDITTSNKNATSGEAKGETQAKFDLDRFITSQSAELQQYQGQTEIQRQNAIAQETARQNHLLVQQFINSIANPAQRQAAIQAYGGI